MSIITFLLLNFLTVFILSAGLYSKTLHTTDSQAKCLDGSTPALYTHRGSNPKNILIYLWGQGQCFNGDVESTKIACIARSKTKFGSSLLWPPTFDGNNKGILDTDAQDNKFAEWTKIIVLQCDGANFQGNRKEPIVINGTSIYSRGSVYMRAHFKWINEKYSLNSASKIVLAGSQSGGIGTFLWVDYLRGLVSNPDKVYGIVDSGLIMGTFIDQTIKKSQEGIQSSIKDSFNPTLDKIADGQDPTPILQPTTTPTPPPQNNQGNSNPFTVQLPGGSLTVELPPGVSIPAGYPYFSGQGIPTGQGIPNPYSIPGFPGFPTTDSSNQNPSESNPASYADTFTSVFQGSNADENLPNTKCVQSLGNYNLQWPCSLAFYAHRYLDGKLLWLESNYNAYIIENLLTETCLTAGSSGFTLQNCEPSQQSALQIYRGVTYSISIEPLLQDGHSVWAISCAWRQVLSNSDIYDSDKQKAPFRGANRMTAREAVQKFVFQDQTIVAVDKYAWPSNQECAF